MPEIRSNQEDWKGFEAVGSKRKSFGASQNSYSHHFHFFVFEEFKASWKPQGVKGFHYPNVKFEIYAWG